MSRFRKGQVCFCLSLICGGTAILAPQAALEEAFASVLPMAQQEPPPSSLSNSFQKLVNCSDLIALGDVTQVEPDISNGTALATFQIAEAIKGNPFGKTVWIPFFLNDGVSRSGATFVAGRRYLLFLIEEERGAPSAGERFPHYFVTDRAVGGDLGQAHVFGDTLTAHVVPPGFSIPLRVRDYVQAIRKALRDSPVDSHRVQSVLAQVRQGLTIGCDGIGCSLDKSGGFDVVLIVDDLTDFLHEGVIPLLEPHIHDPHPGVRRGVFQILRRLAIPTTVPLLLEGLKDSDPRVRHACIEGLQQARSWQAVPWLIAALDENVADEETDRLNTDIGQALRNIIVLNLYLRQGRTEPLDEAWSPIVEGESVPNYLPWDSPDRKIAALRQWREWLEARKWYFPEQLIRSSFLNGECC